MPDPQSLSALPDTGGSAALAEVNPDSLSVLFSRDPLTYTQADRLRIIEALRAQRARWNLAGGATVKPRSGAKTPALPKASETQASLEDLGL